MGAFFVGYLDDAPVATGAWRRRTDVEFGGTWQTAEIKRMYVVARARRVGLARAMLAHLEETARAAGAEAMVLETGMRQPEAITLYVTAGYTPVPGFGFYKDEPLSRCFARSLVVPVAQGSAELLRRGRLPEQPVVVDVAVGVVGRFTQLLWRGGSRRPQESSPIQGGKPNGRSPGGMGLVVRLLERGAVVRAARRPVARPG